MNLSRKDIKRVIEVVTNHCSLNKHLHNIGYEENPRCLCNLSDETGLHIISDCPRYRLLRMSILGKPELSISDLKLQDLNIDDLAEFLSRTKRLP